MSTCYRFIVEWSVSDAGLCVCISQAIINGLDCVYDINTGPTHFRADRKNNGTDQLLAALKNINFKRPDCVVVFSQCETDDPDVWRIYRLDGRIKVSAGSPGMEEIGEAWLK